ncbi:MAG: molybdenum cofactor biosynthesis protein MoaB [Candidatus Thermoplasmatota archaeon]|nr:molybdenum cofactor biosynthesis protein MoaB [Candidatus Thermoplasmatota archaeon]
MSHEEHKKKAPESVRCAVITVSDTRDMERDESGKKIREMLMEEKHEVVGYELVRDEKDEIIEAVESIEADVFLLNGGTGISGRDVTPEALDFFVDKKIPGYGELFRYLSYEDIGSAAMLSRAEAGFSDEQIYFALPGSTAAVELAMEELILPELGHLVHEVHK